MTTSPTLLQPKHAAPLHAEAKDRVYYHGTSKETAAQGILKDGIQPREVSLPQFAKDRSFLAPAKGRVYVSPDISYAAFYALGSNTFGTDFYTRNNIGPLKDKNPYGYLFEMRGEDLRGDALPDEDSIGGFISDLTQMDQAEKRHAEITKQRSPLKWPGEAGELSGVIARAVQSPINSPSTPESLRRELRDAANLCMTDRQRRKILDHDIAGQAVVGKKVQKIMSPQLAKWMLDNGAHVSHLGAIFPIRAWRFKKEDAAKITANEVMSICEEIPLQHSKAASIDQSFVMFPGTSRRKPRLDWPKGIYLADTFQDALDYGPNVFSIRVSSPKLLFTPGSSLSEAQKNDLAYILSPAVDGGLLPPVDTAQETGWVLEALTPQGICYPMLNFPDTARRIRERGYDGTWVSEPMSATQQSLWIVQPSCLSDMQSVTKSASLAKTGDWARAEDLRSGDMIAFPAPAVKVRSVHRENDEIIVLGPPGVIRRFDPQDEVNFLRKTAALPDLESWLAHTHVVNEDGSPRIVYHGSRVPWVAAFDLGKEGTGLVSRTKWGAVWFTSSRDNAEWYTDYKDKIEADVYDIMTYGEEPSFYASINSITSHEDEDSQSLFEVGPFPTREEAEKEGKKEAQKYNSLLEEDTFLHAAYLRIVNPLVVRKVPRTPEFEEAREGGHDGIIALDVADGPIRSDIYVVFDPKQIRSADPRREYQHAASAKMLTAADYNEMFTAFLRAMAEKETDGKLRGLEIRYKELIKEEIAWARRVFKSNSAWITWWLRWYRLTLENMSTPELFQKDWNAYKAKAQGDDSAENSIVNGVAAFNSLHTSMEHFMGTPVPEFDSYRPGFKSIYTVLAELEALEEEWKASLKRFVTPKEGDTKVLEVAGGAWWMLSRGYCEEEGRAMGHCGNGGSDDSDNETIFSFRTKTTDKGKTLWVPHLTFIRDKDDYLGESKGSGNQKPAAKDHPAILALLESDYFAGIKGGGYMPKNNFSVEDLTPEQQEALFALKPTMMPLKMQFEKNGIEDESLQERVCITLSATSSEREIQWRESSKVFEILSQSWGTDNLIRYCGNDTIKRFKRNAEAVASDFAKTIPDEAIHVSWEQLFAKLPEYVIYLMEEASEEWVTDDDIKAWERAAEENPDLTGRERVLSLLKWSDSDGKSDIVNDLRYATKVGCANAAEDLIWESIGYAIERRGFILAQGASAVWNAYWHATLTPEAAIDLAVHHPTTGIEVYTSTFDDLEAMGDPISLTPDEIDLPFDTIDWQTAIDFYEEKLRKDLYMMRNNRRNREQHERRTAAAASVTESPAFKSWFAGSKVVDGSGNPLVLYHGTPNDFGDKNFAVGAGGRGSIESFGFHFGPSEAANNRLARGMEKYDAHQYNWNIMPVYLSIKNPLRLPDFGDWQNLKRLGRHLVRAGIDEQAVNEALSKSGHATRIRALIKVLQAAGYDGVVYFNLHELGGNSWIAFDPRQIKSATGNDGGFDPKSRSMTAAITPTGRTLYHGTNTKIESQYEIPDTKTASELWTISMLLLR